MTGGFDNNQDFHDIGILGQDDNNIFSGEFCSLLNTGREESSRGCDRAHEADSRHSTKSSYASSILHLGIIFAFLGATHEMFNSQEPPGLEAYPTPISATALDPSQMYWQRTSRSRGEPHTGLPLFSQHAARTVTHNNCE
ncbi:hypothetical protein MKZ38_005568 [Zalerion maritima]|uniref:Uncharacterized protein n=1 Tax=Zalerion maritima TaxID=339359 RepID=A0AAD5RJZ2_9PEZI|nr:hypothetical protein MKZ38_005568 [Zalerion maritima]